MASSVPPRHTVPLDLPRLVMRRAGVVGALVLLLAVVLGLARMGGDIDDEVDAAMALASVMARLGQLDQTDDRNALASLHAMQARHPLRHLALQVHAQDGSLLLGPPPAPPAALPLRWLLDLHRAWLSAPDVRRVAWQVPRADGSRWTVSLAASHDSERREAMAGLLDMLALLLLCVAGLLAVMHWNVRRAFAPMGRLLHAITGIESHDPRQVQALPAMPTRELESLAAALRHLGAALDQAEAQRRQLSQQVLTLQEDERARLARDLHDEFGQRLTALRVDAAWLARQVAGDARLLPVVDGMAQQCALVQADIRSLLTRLQPFGPVAADAAQAECLARGLALLQALVDSWQGSGAEPGLACHLSLDWHGADGQPQPWPVGDAAQALWLPRPLWLALYRISQEALTNTARHADARSAGLRLHLRGGRQPGDALQIDWQAWDDGIGLPMAPHGMDSVDGLQLAVLPRGNGLAGLQERVWAQGGLLQCGPVQPGAARPGMRLAASFHTRLLPAPAAAA
ncbi:MAG: histidine kinase [Aquabacterium sp.]|nr:histidine kinase [Aquabacterium sp.]